MTNRSPALQFCQGNLTVTGRPIIRHLIFYLPAACLLQHPCCKPVEIGENLLIKDLTRMIICVKIRCRLKEAHFYAVVSLLQ